MGELSVFEEEGALRGEARIQGSMDVERNAEMERTELVDRPVQLVPSLEIEMGPHGKCSTGLAGPKAPNLG